MVEIQRKIHPRQAGEIDTLNVEGVGDSYPGKLEQIIRHIKTYDVSILRMQETYVSAAPWYVFDDVFLFILSGGVTLQESMLASDSLLHIACGTPSSHSSRHHKG